MGFNNPIIGGGGALVYPAIHSPNYVLGVTGWSVNKDGTAQFTGLVLIGGTFTGTNFVINSSGSFFYSGIPAAGNLIAWDASAAGTDAFGNTFLAGRCSQSNASGVVLQLLNGLLSIGTQAHINAGLAAFVASAAAAGGILTLDSGKQTAIDQDCQVQIKSAAVSGQALAEILGALLVDGGVTISATGGGLLVVTETGGAPASQPVQFIAATAGDRVLGIEVSGDADMRFTVDSNGKIGIGSGAAFADAFIQRGAANQLNVTGADLDIDTAGRGLRVKEGTNARQGTAVLNGTTPVVVANTSVTASSRIFLTIQTPAGGTPASPYVSARTPGTSFSIKSTGAADTSMVAWFITEPG